MIRLVLATMLAATVGRGTMAEPLRHPITTERIAAAISETGMSVRADQVSLLSGVVAATADPQLKVRSIDMPAAGRAMARLECGGGQCVPFMVTLRLSNPEGGPLPLRNATSHSFPQPAAKEGNSPLVHKGSSATLLLNNGPVHISVPVTCLDNGAPGENIRAMATGSRQVYTAQVVSANLLTGRF